LQGKDIELQVLRDRLQQQEKSMKQLTDKVKAEAHDKVYQLLDEEQRRWETEKAKELDGALNQMRVESERQSRALREDLNQERELAQQHLRHIESLKQVSVPWLFGQ
jgi:hypothetical protein